MSSSPAVAKMNFSFCKPRFRSLQLEEAHVNEINHDMHLANTLFQIKVRQKKYGCRLHWFITVHVSFNVDLAIFQPYLDLEAGDKQFLKIQVARPGIEPRSSCSASQELNQSATAAPYSLAEQTIYSYRQFGGHKNRENNW